MLLAALNGAGLLSGPGFNDISFVYRARYFENLGGFKRA
jgi:hypothetical protein